MSAIDPALLQAQWLQYQNNQLAQSAIIPQYLPQQSQGDYVTESQLAAIADFMRSANNAAIAAAEYIGLLEWMATEHSKLIKFSAAQDDLIWRFLHDRDFTLDYVRGAWTKDAIDDNFMNRLANVYLEIAALSPTASIPDRNPSYTGNPNIQFDAVVPQMSIPPLPSSNGSASSYITLDQYLVAQQQGQVAQARAAALRNPAGLYGALFQQ